MTVYAVCFSAAQQILVLKSPAQYNLTQLAYEQGRLENQLIPVDAISM